ncbi:VWA domain-containing protein [Puniceicoccaceae bacterium K14]|nr:VWA domain-containing protein [Puniceicoccaceae bacterium K14]
MKDIVLANPYWLLSLAAIPIIIWMRGRRSVVAVALPFAGAWQRSSFAPNSKILTLPLYLGITLLSVSLARPQKVETEHQSKSRGYDIMLAIDLSSSMYFEDYKDSRNNRINRLQAIKPIITEFIKERTQDRIGLVAFSGRAYTLAPLTFDHEWLARQTDRLSIGLIEDGTAIGDAIAVSANRLQEGSKEKAGEREGAFIVLLTDGENTAGLMEPLDAANIAKEENIPVFAIAAGYEGRFHFPYYRDGVKLGYDMRRSTIDTRTLQQISAITEGAFFRAEAKDTIENAFETIDKSNKVEFEVNQFSTTTELYPYTANAAAIFLIIGALLSQRNKMEGLS